jgi:cytochrome c oxidase subunit 4
MPGPLLRRQARTLVLAWLALLALMLSSLGSAYLQLGIVNSFAGLAIAAVKSAIVLWIFMGLRQASGLLRLVALVGFGAFGLLLILSGVDYLTRPAAPAPVERAQQLRPPRADLDTS